MGDIDRKIYIIYAVIISVHNSSFVCRRRYAGDFKFC